MGGTWAPFGAGGCLGNLHGTLWTSPLKGSFWGGVHLENALGSSTPMEFFLVWGASGEPPQTLVRSPFWGGRHLGDHLSLLWDFHSDGVLFGMRGTGGSTFRGACRESYGVPEALSGVGGVYGTLIGSYRTFPLPLESFFGEGQSFCRGKHPQNLCYCRSIWTHHFWGAPSS